MSPGEATIRASVGSSSKTATVTVLAPFVSLSLGSIHACAQTAAKALYCWGANGSSQLGRLHAQESCDVAGSPVPCSTTPRRGVTTPLFATVAGGYATTCGLTEAGDPYCWGNNEQRQLGGTAAAVPDPVRAPGVLKMATVETGRWYACGLDESGLAYCWGVGFTGYGNLGSVAGNDCQGLPCNLAPTPVSGGHQFVQLSVGQLHACGLTALGQAWCWGANGGGQLGNGSMSPVDGGESTPRAVLGGITFTAISAGEGHTCGLSNNGAAYCWGDNFQGQLGGTQEFNALTPSLVKGGLSFASVHAGGSHSCGLSTAGVAYCWGFNAQGQLGDGTTKFRGLPGPVARNLVFVQLAVRRQFACGRTAAGRVYCWGQNLYGQIGAGELRPEIQFLVPTGVGGIP